MARPRSQHDDEIFAHLLAALAETGEKSLTFGVLSRRCGLAPATLAQRYGSVDGMIRAAVLSEWTRLTQVLAEAEAEALASTKGAQALLKRLPCPSLHILSISQRDDVLCDAAEAWRKDVEAALAIRRGGGVKGRDAAALIFAAWQGRNLWEQCGGKGFRLSDLLKAMP